MFKKIVHRNFTLDVDVIVHQFKTSSIVYADVFIDLSPYGMGYWMAKGKPSDYMASCDGYVSEYMMFESLIKWDIVAKFEESTTILSDKYLWNIETKVEIVNDFLDIMRLFTRATENYSEVYGRISDILPSILKQCDLRPIQMDRWNMVKRQVSY